MYINFSEKPAELGNSQALLLNSYIQADNHLQMRSPAVKQKMQEQQKTLTQDKKTVKKIKTFYEEVQAQPISQNIPENSARYGDRQDEIVTLLHDAIQKEQRYPPIALQMERQGRVTVAFTLFVDGTIANLRVIKSSDTASLDEAATQAVMHAAPFIQVKNHIHHVEEYQIDVVFELS